MTFAQLCVIFWHDLAAPILVGIITTAIVSWWRNRR
ncbi:MULTISPECIES: type I toxin-antitoxin system toxin Ldr family protein [Pseudocitrobacter]|jgi:small toxic polypeptide LdrA/B/C/D|uniref:Small toxic polypeptide LdrA n=1 Tax=Pseudocitrobacter corydidari TaxID=2891570 RepID=A0ABY3S8J1_9ENTR|nr:MULTISPECIES: type I toxin-antitoxin system toxin Ldr family protein [Pseudocitrobacter]MEB4675808.1 type I toxin-antitoxin system toxin Ldr family protein [Enterobacteriaceae bacterium G50]MDF3826719.1 type I toxin-antitoxin system toxin Ldr family protein [Pseudocitrobacter sp. 2023EL-00150]MEC5372638.1 type I toxin-antitoxin system toxin Ldr family protein [Pseudocitrobacter sp. MW920760]RAU45034.1 small toxic polypeptide LdrA/LdrC [Pseudocitrobacter sp. RIT 415]UGS43037.1 Small toxic po